MCNQRWIINRLSPITHQKLQVHSINNTIAKQRRCYINHRIVRTPGFDESEEVLDVDITIHVKVRYWRSGLVYFHISKDRIVVAEPRAKVGGYSNDARCSFGVYRRDLRFGRHRISLSPGPRAQFVSNHVKPQEDILHPRIYPDTCTG